MKNAINYFSKRAQANGKKGFTLIEVVVAVAILAIVSVIILQVFGVSSNITTEAERFSGNTLTNSSALDRVLGSDNITLDSANTAVNVDFGSGDNRNSADVEIDEENVTKQFTFENSSGTVVSRVNITGDVYSSKQSDDDGQALKAFNAYDDGFQTIN